MPIFGMSRAAADQVRTRLPGPSPRHDVLRAGRRRPGRWRLGPGR